MRQTGEVEPGAGRAGSDDVHRPESKLYALLSRLRLALGGPSDGQLVRQLRRQIEQQSSLVRRAEAALAGAEIFERASVAAHMGLWQCELPSERLTWSDGVYDTFGLERRSGIVRSNILRSYSEESLVRLQRIRREAIENGAGFGLDAEICCPDGKKRWIRISATVERRNGDPIRLFGIKQDITAEKQQFERIEYLAGHDVMTGLANRPQFEARLAEICEPEGPGGVLILVDLDRFKEVNDTFGHAVGDECLIEIARRLTAVCHAAELIARIGGDEFALIFGPSASPQRIAETVQRIVHVAQEPMNCSGRALKIGASVGYAFATYDTPMTLFTKADNALYAAKAAGRPPFSGPSQAA